MMTSRKDFEMLANLIALTRALPHYRGDPLDWLAERLADELAKDTPSFNRTKFLGAAGVQGSW